MSDYAVQRERMVRDLIAARGVRDERVLAALRKTPRHLFVKDHLRSQAYGDHALPIGSAQTISQPYIVARMSELLEVGPEHSVLSTDLGQAFNPPVEDGLAIMADKFLEAGFTEEEVRVMAVDNTRRLAGVEDARSASVHGRRDGVHGHQDAGLDAPRR